METRFHAENANMKNHDPNLFRITRLTETYTIFSVGNYASETYKSNNHVMDAFER